MNTDPISDLLTRLRNAQMAGHDAVNAPSSKVKVAIAKILKEEGYLSEVNVYQEGPKATLHVGLIYDGRKPKIRSIKRISTPGRRVYRKSTELPRVLSDMGIAIVSTSAGLMTNKTARKRHLGGEIICEIF
ncbi:MAG: 30S ribosomal protein S8 [Patescibacteria group bacterium]|nr:30S ribosomal protein S8 [Patescibacteria group bacterium]